MSIRDQIRAAVMGAKPTSKVIEAFNTKIEIRTPRVSEVMGQDYDRKTSMAYLLISYCFVPGTEEKVFEPADAESLLNLPFNEDLTKVVGEINKLGNFEQVADTEGKDLSVTPGVAQSSP